MGRGDTGTSGPHVTRATIGRVWGWPGAYLQFAIDGGLEALLVLSPDTTAWSVPVGALDKAVEQHPGYLRGRRRVHDLVERVREVLGDDHEPDLAELEDHVRQAMLDASEAGWRLGLLMSRSSVSS